MKNKSNNLSKQQEYYNFRTLTAVLRKERPIGLHRLNTGMHCRNGMKNMDCALQISGVKIW